MFRKRFGKGFSVACAILGAIGVWAAASSAFDLPSRDTAQQPSVVEMSNEAFSDGLPEAEALLARQWVRDECGGERDCRTLADDRKKVREALDL